ncbi:MAG: response regulator transcription factor [Vicinamibacterales bacterium]|jgi:DNA-binding response OmpR family regulator|nr:response regulator transcription factor [Vicinamibacterales bacterium]
MASRILVVEDDQDIADLVAHNLGRAGYATEIVGTGTAVLPRVRQQTPDLVVLDLMLPGLSGLEICRLMRGDPQTAAVPIIMLTARAEEEDRVRGLELGADDYLTKPFSPRELVARVGAVLRRTLPHGLDKVLRFGPIVVDLDRHEVTEHGRAVRLTAKEFLLLQFLIEHRGRVLSRDLLLSDVWGYQYTGGTRTVDVHIRRLREKLPVLVEHIVTVKQFGYKFVDTA